MTRQGKGMDRPTRVMKERARQKKGGEPECEPPDSLAKTTTAAQPFLNPNKKCHGHQRGVWPVVACQIRGLTRCPAEGGKASGKGEEAKARPGGLLASRRRDGQPTHALV